MTTSITRHFASITNGRWGPRQVHYRRVGSGPVVLCLHQSPLSSRDMLATMERWKTHFTCIAPDTPGFGLSDPLGVDRAEASDFAEAVIEFMDALGIERAAIYGFHTGAMISGALAAAHPDRIVCAAVNGYVVMTEPDRQDFIEHYLPPLQPKWDGSHLTWLWARMREQTIFFPWYRKSSAARLSFDVPPAEGLHNALLDFMRAGDHYRVGYRAAFTMRSDIALRQTTTPILVTAADTDVLSADLDKVSHPASCVTVTKGGTAEQTLDLCRDYIKRHKPPKMPRSSVNLGLRGRLWQDYVDVEAGQLRVRRNDDADGRTVLILHEPGGSTESIDRLAAGFIGHRPVLAINLPGHGESDNTLPRGKVTIGGFAKAIDQALQTLKINEVDVIGVGGGAFIALELASLVKNRVNRTVMLSPVLASAALRSELIEHYTPEIKPVWYGGHLVEAWYVVRDQSLFWPWFRAKRSNIINSDTELDPMRVQVRLLDLFRSNGMWRHAHQAAFAYPWEKKLATYRNPILLASPIGDPLRSAAVEATSAMPHLLFIELPREQQDWARILLQQLR
jgi:pimeloyl-ACP methyl ester carboxylesterase